MGDLQGSNTMNEIAQIALWAGRKGCHKHIVGFAKVDADSAGTFLRHRWGIVNGYAARKIPTKTNDGRVRDLYIFMHRVVLGLPNGVGNRLGVVDHIDNDRLNNCRSNVRVTNDSTNIQRANVKICKSGFIGVYQQRRKWVAKITKEGRYVSLSMHASPESAARAYDQEAVRLHGVYARTNVSIGALAGKDAT